MVSTGITCDNTAAPHHPYAIVLMLNQIAMFNDYINQHILSIKFYLADFLLGWMFFG